LPESLSLRALNRALLSRQMLLAREPVSALCVIERLVGLQAQQARPPFLGLWSRIAGFQRRELLDLVRNKDAVRATMMRCTLHLMSRRDFLAFRPVLQPVLTYAMRTILQARTQTFDVEAILAEARRLYTGSPRTFTQIRDALVQLYPDADERAMGYTVRTHAPLVIPPAEHEWAYRADPEFALVEDWLNEPLSAEDAAHQLVRRYLAAFGPASVQDFQSWSGLQRMAPVFADLRPEFVTFRDERKRELFDLPDAPRPAEDAPAPPCFIADYDNLTLAHADRTRVISDEHRKAIATKNGQILPLILVDGFVAGTWKAARERKTAVITVTPFASLTLAVRESLESEGESLARFVDPEAGAFAVRFATVS
jgi:hypothetical protein